MSSTICCIYYTEMTKSLGKKTYYAYQSRSCITISYTYLNDRIVQNCVPFFHLNNISCDMSKFLIIHFENEI